jgi:hypothetical protein
MVVRSLEEGTDVNENPILLPESFEKATFPSQTNLVHFRLDWKEI